MALPTHGAVDANGPGFKSTPITPTDGVDITEYKRVCELGIYVGTGGNIVGRLDGDAADRTFKNVPSGTHLHYRFKRISNTLTTAADILGIGG